MSHHLPGMNKKMGPTRHVRALQIIHIVLLKSLEVVLKSLYLTPINTLAKSHSVQLNNGFSSYNRTSLLLRGGNMIQPPFVQINSP